MSLLTDNISILAQEFCLTSLGMKEATGRRYSGEENLSPQACQTFTIITGGWVRMSVFFLVPLVPSARMLCFLVPVVICTASLYVITGIAWSISTLCVRCNSRQLLGELWLLGVTFSSALGVDKLTGTSGTSGVLVLQVTTGPGPGIQSTQSPAHPIIPNPSI